MDINNLEKRFKEIFKSQPMMFRSPGRINIIGEHTDYNDGFVLPAAIDKAIYLAIAKREDAEIHLYAESYQEFHISSMHFIKKTEKTWANYILGVVDQFLKKGYSLTGLDIYLDGDVPLGAGLSSSAALECAVAFAINDIFSLNISQIDLALIGQKAEHEFAGVNCGIMDQFASVFGKEKHAILLDCRSMDYQYIPLDLKGYKFVLLNTNVKHKLSESAYNQRRRQCELGLELVKANLPDIESLREVSLAQLNKFVMPYDMEVYRRCKYVVEEITRTQLAAQKLKDGDLTGLGQLMLETHKGLSELYEVSCKELDFLVESVKDRTEVLGARMMGGGFGGCTINLVKAEKSDELVAMLKPLYQKEFGFSLEAYLVEIDGGSSSINSY